MTVNEQALDGFLDIDEFDLEREWTRQPKLYFEWAKNAADRRSSFDEAKNASEVVRAEVYQEVRDDPGRFGVEGKPTEKAIEAAVVQDVRVVGVAKKLSRARHAYDVANAAVFALDHRKAALENCVRLFLANYYSEPKAPEGRREEIEQVKTDRAFGKRRKGGRKAEGKLQPEVCSDE